MRTRKPVTSDQIRELIWYDSEKRYYHAWYSVFDDMIPEWARDPLYSGDYQIRLIKNRIPIADKIIEFACAKGYITKKQRDELLAEAELRYTLSLAEG